jgi:flagellar biosynthesis GTPase FlhF
MELKRILARDTRSATEQAMALYGPDVLIISNNRVAGQTELVVALDVSAESTTEILNDDLPTMTVATEDLQDRLQTSSGSDNAFGDHLHALLKRSSMEASLTETAVAQALTETNNEQCPLNSVNAEANVVAECVIQSTVTQEKVTQEKVTKEKVPVKSKKTVKKVAVAVQKKRVRKNSPAIRSKTETPELTLQAYSLADNRHDQIRSQEIVSLVREELAALRREFRLSQQTMGWESQHRWPEPIEPIVENLVQSAMPFELRTLLIDGLKEKNTFKQAIKSIRDTLMCNLKRPQAALPTAGVHVLAGPSGAGKTLMVARLAQQMALAEGAEKVAVVSFQDTRAGAWSQTQMLCAQSGVDSFRATNVDTLKLVLEELSSRQLVLIDTASVQMTERLLDVMQVLPTAFMHAVVPADASAVTLKRVLTDSKMNWSSIMISKVDESSAPWALLQFLTQDATKLSLSVGSCSDRVAAGGMEMSPSVLVNLAIAHLTPAELSTQPTLSNPAELKRTPVARKTAQREIHG